MASPIGGIGSGMANLGALGGAKADGAGAAGGAGAAAGSPEELQKALEELTKLLQMLMEILKNMGLAGPDAKAPAAPAGASGVGGGGAPQAARGGGGGGGGGDGMDAAGGGGGAQAAGQTTPTGPAVNIQGIQVDPSLAPALEAIANHPDGAKLLEAAKANGLTSIGVNSNLNPNGGGGTEGLFNPNTKSIEIANPNGENLINILAHELGHAATSGDGNSQLEESTVNNLGAKIQQDLTGRASTFNLDEGSYSNLNRDNGIVNNLRGLGIRV